MRPWKQYESISKILHWKSPPSELLCQRSFQDLYWTLAEAGTRLSWINNCLLQGIVWMVYKSWRILLAKSTPLCVYRPNFSVRSLIERALKFMVSDFLLRVTYEFVAISFIATARFSSSKTAPSTSCASRLAEEILIVLEWTLYIIKNGEFDRVLLTRHERTRWSTLMVTQLRNPVFTSL